MKHIISLFLLLSITLALSGCGLNTLPPEPDPTPDDIDSSDVNLLPAPAQADEPEQPSPSTVYPKEYMGIWYGFGTDGNEAQTELEVTSINSNQVDVNGNIVTFINSYIAETPAISAGNGRSLKTLYILGKDSNGEPAIEIYTVDASTNQQCTQSMCCYRQSVRENIQDFIPNGKLPSQPTQSAVRLSEKEAEAKLTEWLGDLGTWVAGYENVLVFNGMYNCDGKDYYQFALKGLVDDHLTTLTWYVISVDGTEMFEGQCMHGSISKF